MKTLRTVRDVVDALGGSARLARWLDVGTSTVSNWIANEHIPPGWHLRLVMEIQRRGHEFDKAIFGLDAWKPLDAPPRVRKCERTGAAA